MATTITTKARTEFNTRQDSFRELVMLALYAKKGKPVLLKDVAKKVYGNAKEESRIKVKATIVGLNMMIADLKLAYQPVTFSGRGDEATFGLFPKTAKRKAA